MTLRVALFFAILVSNPVIAAEDRTERLRACMSEASDARRLTCYDQAMGREPTPPASTAAAVSVTPAAVASTKAAEEEFGVRGGEVARQRELSKADGPERIEQLTATVAKVSKLPHGELVITLDNDQVWQQKDAVSYFPLKLGDEVTIRSGALGSYKLEARNGRTTSVTRVR